MKKKIVSVALALTLAFAMSITASAAGSVTAGSVAQTAESTPAPAATPAAPAADPGLATATQQLDQAAITEFAATTTISSDVNATISAVSVDTAKATIAQAKAVVGANAFVATIVDINVPAGTQKASITLGCPNVWAGQSVTILHQKADGSWEAITPDKVANNSVTFTMNSFSPVAIVINATAPKTGDIVMVIAAMAVICLAAAAAFGKKAAAR